MNSSRDAVNILESAMNIVANENALAQKKQEYIALDSFTHDLFISSSQYTIRSLCNEFSCSFESITPDLIEKKKDFYCKKLMYLIGKYNYCKFLTENIEEINGKSNITYGDDDIPKLDNIKEINFETVLNTVEKINHYDFPDFELHRNVLGYFSLVCENIIREIDRCCDKIDLANNFLNSMKRSKDTYLGRT